MADTGTQGGVLPHAVAMTCNWCGTKVVVPLDSIELAGCVHCPNAWDWGDGEGNALAWTWLVMAPAGEVYAEHGGPYWRNVPLNWPVLK